MNRGKEKKKELEKMTAMALAAGIIVGTTSNVAHADTLEEVSVVSEVENTLGSETVENLINFEKENEVVATEESVSEELVTEEIASEDLGLEDLTDEVASVGSASADLDIVLPSEEKAVVWDNASEPVYDETLDDTLLPEPDWDNVVPPEVDDSVIPDSDGSDSGVVSPDLGLTDDGDVIEKKFYFGTTTSAGEIQVSKDYSVIKYGATSHKLGVIIERILVDGDTMIIAGKNKAGVLCLSQFNVNDMDVEKNMAEPLDINGYHEADVKGIIKGQVEGQYYFYGSAVDYMGEKVGFTLSLIGMEETYKIYTAEQLGVEDPTIRFMETTLPGWCLLSGEGFKSLNTNTPDYVNTRPSLVVYDLGDRVMSLRVYSAEENIYSLEVKDSIKDDVTFLLKSDTTPQLIENPDVEGEFFLMYNYENALHIHTLEGEVSKQEMTVTNVDENCDLKLSASVVLSNGNLVIAQYAVKKDNSGVSVARAFTGEQAEYSVLYMYDSNMRMISSAVISPSEEMPNPIITEIREDAEGNVIVVAEDGSTVKAEFPSSDLVPDYTPEEPSTPDQPNSPSKPEVDGDEDVVTPEEPVNPDKDETTNNGSTNNGTTSNGTTSNGSTNNGTTSNGTTNNGLTNSGTTSNGTTSNGTNNSNGTNSVVVESATNNSAESLPSTGAVVGYGALLTSAAALVGSGFGLLRKKRK